MTKTNQSLVSKAVKRFEWLVGFMIIRYRFVHQLLNMMTKTATNAVPTMGVTVTPGGKFQLYYSPEFFDTLSDSEGTYVFFHEILHLALHHCTKRKSNPHCLWNIATDLAVNELIPESDACSAPKLDGKLMGMHVSEFKKKYPKILDKQCAEWYMDFLRKEDYCQGCQGCDRQEDEDKEKQDGPQGEGEGQPQDGQEGQGEGQPQDGQGQQPGGKGKPGKGKSGQQKGAGGQPGEGNPDCPMRNHGGFDSHKGWDENEIADERVRDKIKHIERMDTWGDVPQSTKELVSAAQIRRINWRNKIRTWFGLQVWKDKITTRKRPNRRTGFIHPGFKRSVTDKWLVAADTSGSIDSDLLGQWLGVINQLVEVMPIDFMQFDCGMTEKPHPYERRKVNLDFKGRGGTDFGPVMEATEKGRYKGVMILTDGCASPPEKPKAKVLWVLPVGCTPPVDWGERIFLSKYV
jgi:predicted metal-dependent peptidase